MIEGMVMQTLDLCELRNKDKGQTQRQPFPHQNEALAALRKTFTLKNGTGKGALLVFPTGGGKTFTTVKYLGDEVIPKGIKILWLAHSFHLLDQAYQEFCQYAKWITSRETLAIRVVSGSPAHDKAYSIDLDDDVIIMTTQTAIRTLHTISEDATGKRVQTKFRHFLEACRTKGLLVVLDEAHHAPAFGCRNLLIGKEEPRIGIRRILPKANLLGLTATPTYTLEKMRGWLKEIFEQDVIYEALLHELIEQRILARPNFIEKPTGREFTVPDAAYNRIVRDHADLPNEIVDKLANDAARNDYIVAEYVQNRHVYGKTIMFADRWFQCRYLMQKLQKHGVRANVVYSHIDADPGSAEARNQRTETENARVLQEFKYGKDGKDTLDVLINVRMLTEGTDIPSVRTVFVTRQTTSSILMTQMIGRALRGKRAGGADEANIVLFHDDWKRLINWARPSLEGGKDPTQVVRGYRPLEYISVSLIDRLCKQINVESSPSLTPYRTFLPVGWYQTEYTVATSEDNFDETESVIEFVMVYEHTKDKFERFIQKMRNTISDEWSREYIDLEDEKILEQVNRWVEEGFDRETDSIGNTLDLDLVRIVRHLAWNRGSVPVYQTFNDREQYDLDRLARQHFDKPMVWNSMLQSEFDRPASLWKTFYKLFGNFRKAFLFAVEKIVAGDELVAGGVVFPPPPNEQNELSEAEKEQVILRDGRCLACSVERGKARLQVGHIIAKSLGGPTTVENSQTLCGVCNRTQKTDEINFRIHNTRLQAPREPRLLPRDKKEDVKRSLTRLVNFFYRCQAVCRVHVHERASGKYHATWKVELYAGNNPEWLLQYKPLLLDHIRASFACPHLMDIVITSPDFVSPPAEKVPKEQKPRRRSKKGRARPADYVTVDDVLSPQEILLSWDGQSDWSSGKSDGGVEPNQ